MVSNVTVHSVWNEKTSLSSTTDKHKTEKAKTTESAQGILQNLESLEQKKIRLQKEKIALTEMRKEIVYRNVAKQACAMKKQLTESKIRKISQAYLQRYIKTSVYHDVMQLLETLDREEKSTAKGQVECLERQCKLLKGDLAFFERMITQI